MNKILYNQLSEKLYNSYCEAKMNNVEKQFVKDLYIEQKIVVLFEELYKNEKDTEGGLYTHGIFQAIKDFFPQEPRLHFLPEMSIAERGHIFAIQSHRDVNQQYGDNRDKVPYEYHLWSTVQFFKKYKHHIPINDQDTVEAGCWNHDVVEDGQKTFNDLKNATNEHVAKIACAVTTNVHGYNRKARADENYYNRIRSIKYAAFVKLCDRLANISNGGKMVDGYRKEMPEFLASLRPEIDNYPDMVQELNELVGLTTFA